MHGDMALMDGLVIIQHQIDQVQSQLSAVLQHGVKFLLPGGTILPSRVRAALMRGDMAFMDGLVIIQPQIVQVQS